MPRAPRLRPDAPPPPEAFGALPDSLSAAEPEPKDVRGTRTASGLRAPAAAARALPRGPPPAEPTQEQGLPEGEVEDSDGDDDDDDDDDDGGGRGGRTTAAAAAAASARRRRAKPEPAPAPAPLPPRKKNFGPVLPPRAPPQPVLIMENLIPRGRMDIEVLRVVGVGSLGVARLGASSAFMSAELFLGASHRRVQTRSPLWKNLESADDFEPPPEPEACTLQLVVAEGVAAPNPPLDLPQSEWLLLPPLLFYQIFMQRSGLLGTTDELVAEGVVPAAQLFTASLRTQRSAMRDGLDSSRYLGEDFTLPLRRPDAKRGDGKFAPPLTTAVGAAANISCRVRFTAAQCGALVVTPHEARRLKLSRSLFGAAPTIRIGVDIGGSDGPLSAHGSPVKAGDERLYLGDEDLMIWIDHSTAVGHRPLHVEVCDLGGPKVVLHASLRLAPLLRNIMEAVDHTIDLRPVGSTAGSDVDVGSIELRSRFYAAGELVVQVCTGHNMASADGTSDLFIELESASRIRPQKCRTRVCSARGADPIWHESFVFDVVDQVELRIVLWEREWGKDVELGEVTIDLDSAYRFGLFDPQVGLKKKTSWGGFADVGMLKLELDFVGPKGLAYPMLNPTRKSYDDLQRKRRKGATAAEAEALLAHKQQAVVKVAEEHEEALRQEAGGEFSDREVQSAFDFLDLDHNLVVGAAELRHVLTCMGELVTAAEIDEMIRLCDHDGDGQISFFEFYQMAKAANPGDLSWKPKAEKDYRTKSSGLAPGAPKPPPIVIYDDFGRPIDVIDAGDDAVARKRAVALANEAAKHAEKRRLCEQTVRELELRMPDLQASFQRFRKMPGFREGGLCSYDEMCKVLGTDAMGAAKNLREIFGVFGDAASVGRVSMRELLLALSQFVGAQKAQRINFCFFLFDEDGSGDLGADELVQILQAAHLSSRAEPGLRAKVDKMMAQFDKDGSGSISLEEFVMLAGRFPNLVLPDFEVRDERGNLVVAADAGALASAADAARRQFAQAVRGATPLQTVDDGFGGI